MARRLRNVHTLRVVRGRRLGDTTFEKYHEAYGTDQGFLDEHEEIIPICTHGHVIHNPQELGASCYCGSLLCTDCSRLRCEIDGQVETQCNIRNNNCVQPDTECNGQQVFEPYEENQHRKRLDYFRN